MQLRPLLLSTILLLHLASLQTVMTDQCALHNLQCTKYLSEGASTCLYLSECINSLIDSHLNTVQWYRCETVLCQPRHRKVISSNNGPIYISPEGNLCFRRFDSTYAGLYCYETMPNSTCTPVEVVKVETPKIKVMKSNVTVVTGGIAEQNTAILQCDRPVEGCPSGHIIWKYEQHTLSNNSRFMIITTSNTTKLIINNVTVNDSGKYECEVIDLSNGGQYSERVHLNVSNAILQIINASLCSNQQLQCNNVIDNPNPEYQWRHNDNIIVAAANASLNLFKIKAIDFGLYYCWLKPSPYGTVVTKVLLLRPVPLLSDYVFILIHHQKYSHLVHYVNQIDLTLQSYISRHCANCCDVTIVMGSLWPCQCDKNTSVYMFRLNGTSSLTINVNSNVQEGNLTFSMCSNNNCCEFCDNRSNDESSETKLAMTITMATLIGLLLLMAIIILLSYQWYRHKRLQIIKSHDKKNRLVAIQTNHRNNNFANGQVHIGNHRDYDKLDHHRNDNLTNTVSGANKTTYESLLCY